MRRSKFFLVFYMCLIPFISMAQSVRIGPGMPDTSAILDAHSSYGGVLIPRMTTAQRNMINTPANGLHIYNTDENCVQFYDSLYTVWNCYCPDCKPFYEHNLFPTNPTSSSYSGKSLDISGDYAVLGSPGNHTGGNDQQGMAHIFQRSGTEWTHQATLVAHDGAANDNFGQRVAIDGDYALVSAPFHDTQGMNNRGKAYIFKRNGTSWNLEAELIASNGAASDFFGNSVDLEGDRAVIGANDKTINGTPNAGAVYVFQRSGSNWNEQFILTSPGGPLGERFASSIALSGDDLIVGAPLCNVLAFNAGRAYVFHFNGTSWQSEGILSASDAAAEDHFGEDVVIVNAYAVVGAPDHDTQGMINRGQAYVYKRTGNIWMQDTMIVSSNGMAQDRFGSAVAITSSTLGVGAPGFDLPGAGLQGAGYLYTLTGQTWGGEVMILGSDSNSNDQFGSSMAMDGNRVAIGAPTHGEPYQDVQEVNNLGQGYIFIQQGSQWTEEDYILPVDAVNTVAFGETSGISGSHAVICDRGNSPLSIGRGYACVFTRSGSQWVQQATLRTSDVFIEAFGAAAGISGDVIIIGDPLKDNMAALNQGRAYVFNRNGQSWTEGPSLLASDGGIGAFFGSGVSIDGDYAVIGASHGGANLPGKAYVFFKSGGIWTQQAILQPSDGVNADRFGEAVSISGNTVVVGAPNHDTNGNTDSGKAYVFTRSGTVWTQQSILTPPDPMMQDHFAKEVSVSGDYALIGSPDKDVGPAVDQGKAYVFKRTGTIWALDTMLIAMDGEGEDQFGFSVGLQGTDLVIGAIEAGPLDQGTVFYYKMEAGSWVQQSIIKAAQGGAFDYFGASACIESGIIVVGATNFEDIGRGFIFARH